MEDGKLKAEDAEACTLIAEWLYWGVGEARLQVRDPKGRELLNHAIQYLVHREHYPKMRIERLLKNKRYSVFSACA
jgi:hypothetical protein